MVGVISALQSEKINFELSSSYVSDSYDTFAALQPVPEQRLWKRKSKVREVSKSGDTSCDFLLVLKQWPSAKHSISELGKLLAESVALSEGVFEAVQFC